MKISLTHKFTVNVLLLSLFMAFTFSAFVMPLHSVFASELVNQTSAGGTFFFRDNNNPNNGTAPIISLDRSSYRVGDTAILTINDANANVDLFHNDNITATVSGTHVKLTETDPTSGIFVGNFRVSGPISINYVPDPTASSRARITLSTSAPGTVHVKDIMPTADNFNEMCFKPITYPINVTLADGAVFTPGTMLVNMSFVNIVYNSAADDLEQMVMEYKKPGSGWDVISKGGFTDGSGSLGVGDIDLATNTIVSDPSLAGYGGQITTGQFVLALPTDICRGGAGGGVVSAGLVFNVIASTAAITGGAPAPPIFDLSKLLYTQGALPDDIKQEVMQHDPDKPLLPENTSFDYPLYIDGKGYVLGGYQNTIKTVTEKTGTPVDIQLHILGTDLTHIALYANLQGTSTEIGDSDTYIIYDKGQPLQKVDPHGYFDHIGFDLTTEAGKNKIDYTITFANPMDKSDIIFRAWTATHASADVKLVDVMEVVSGATSSENKFTLDKSIPVLNDTSSLYNTNPVAETPVVSKVPSWIKNNAKLWNAGSIQDKEFVTGIQYLISEKIISVPTQTTDSSVTNTIPKWIKSNAGFWADGQITDDDFLKGIEYLVKTGIITP